MRLARVAYTAHSGTGDPLADPKTPDLQMCYSARLPHLKASSTRSVLEGAKHGIR
jgi:hypothetical protein